VGLRARLKFFKDIIMILESFLAISTCVANFDYNPLPLEHLLTAEQVDHVHQHVVKDNILGYLPGSDSMSNEFFYVYELGNCELEIESRGYDENCLQVTHDHAMIRWNRGDDSYKLECDDNNLQAMQDFITDNKIW
jgi:hypothetical protein